MSRPLPTSPDHELHDALLVAQYLARDYLDPSAQREAEFFVSSCGACAALAADLRTVSGAVAWEPVPRRRRDFRISAEQADDLRGNAFSRFMRRLALPSASGLRPAAAGVMSLGLLFMVAGAAWPGDQTVVMEAAPVVAPVPASEGSGVPAQDPDPVLGDITDADAAEGPTGLTQPREDDLAAPATEVQDATNKASRSLDESLRLEQSERSLEAAGAGPNQDAEADLAQEDAFMLDTLGASEPELPEEQALGSAGVDVPASPAPVESRAQKAVAADDSALEQEISAALPNDDGIDIEAWLIALGVALAVGGALLLMLVLVARRRTDPLLP